VRRAVLNQGLFSRLEVFAVDAAIGLDRAVGVAHDEEPNAEELVRCEQLLEGGVRLREEAARAEAMVDFGAYLDRPGDSANGRSQHRTTRQLLTGSAGYREGHVDEAALLWLGSQSFEERGEIDIGKAVEAGDKRRSQVLTARVLILEHAVWHEGGVRHLNRGGGLISKVSVDLGRHKARYEGEAVLHGQPPVADRYRMFAGHESCGERLNEVDAAGSSLGAGREGDGNGSAVTWIRR